MIAESFIDFGRAFSGGSLANLASAAITTTLLWAGAEKLRDRGPTAEVVVHLGGPREQAPTLASALAITEVGVAIGVAARPGSAIAAAAVIVLATLFAIAGWVAIHRGARVRCTCFGGGGASVLGRSQIVAWPLWISAAGLAWASHPPPRSLEETAALLTLLTTAIALSRVPLAARALLTARADRRSAKEMYRWLP